MSEQIKPLNRAQLASFLKDPRAIEYFEKLLTQSGVVLPAELQEMLTLADSANSRSAQALGMLENIRHSLELIALRPASIHIESENVQGGQLLFGANENPLPAHIPEYGIFPYGDMYSNTATVVVVAAANTAYEITSNINNIHSHLMTFGGGHYLQADRNGIYECNWSVSISTANAGDALEAGLMINGTAQTEGLAHGTVSNANAEIEISGSANLAVAALDQISLYLMNHAAARDITFKHVSFTAKLIDWR